MIDAWVGQPSGVDVISGHAWLIDHEPRVLTAQRLESIYPSTPGSRALPGPKPA